MLRSLRRSAPWSALTQWLDAYDNILALEALTSMNDARGPLLHVAKTRHESVKQWGQVPREEGNCAPYCWRRNSSFVLSVTEPSCLHADLMVNVCARSYLGGSRCHCAVPANESSTNAHANPIGEDNVEMSLQQELRISPQSVGGPHLRRDQRTSPPREPLLNRR